MSNGAISTAKMSIKFSSDNNVDILGLKWTRGQYRRRGLGVVKF